MGHLMTTAEKQLRGDDSGSLYVVATPIGNLHDITMRAIATLQAVDWIVCEDTRHSSRLLNFYKISKPLISFHQHNEQQRLRVILEKLHAGSDVALISDAGTPLISDPGYSLIRTAASQNITIIPIPGASALIAALSVSSLPCQRFCFEGFLPAKKTARRNALQRYQTEDRTMVFYETMLRLPAMLVDCIEVFGADREAVLAREISKKFEQIVHQPLGGIAMAIADGTISSRGELVLLIAGLPGAPDHSGDAMGIYSLLRGKLSHRDAVALAAELTGVRKNQLNRQVKKGATKERCTPRLRMSG